MKLNDDDIDEFWGCIVQPSKVNDYIWELFDRKEERSTSVCMDTWTNTWIDIILLAGEAIDERV